MAKKEMLPPAAVSRDWRTVDEIDHSVKKLERRVAQVEAFDLSRATQGDERVLLSDFNNTLREVFGDQSPEVHDHTTRSLWSGPMYVGMADHEIAAGKEAGRQSLLAILRGLIARLEEKKLDLGTPLTANPVGAFEQLSLHERIRDLAADRFADGHYDDAVFAASKALVNMVKERSGKHDLDGKALMTTVFSAANPILAFNALADATDRVEQEGMMNLYVGAVLAIRNPGGHGFPGLTPARALEYLSLISMLARCVQEANRRTPTS